YLSVLVGQFRINADQAIQNAGRGRQNLIHGQGDLAIDRIDGLARGSALFLDQEVQSVERKGKLAAKNLGELQVFRPESIELRAFHVKSADDLVAPGQGDGQGAVRAFGSLDVVRVRGG